MKITIKITEDDEIKYRSAKICLGKELTSRIKKAAIKVINKAYSEKKSEIIEFLTPKYEVIETANVSSSQIETTQTEMEDVNYTQNQSYTVESEEPESTIIESKLPRVESLDPSLAPEPIYHHPVPHPDEDDTLASIT